MEIEWKHKWRGLLLKPLKKNILRYLWNVLTRKCYLTFQYYLSLTLSHTQTQTHTHPPTHTPPHTQTHTQPHTHVHTHSLKILFCHKISRNMIGLKNCFWTFKSYLSENKMKEMSQKKQKLKLDSKKYLFCCCCCFGCSYSCCCGGVIWQQTNASDTIFTAKIR